MTKHYSREDFTALAGRLFDATEHEPIPVQVAAAILHLSTMLRTLRRFQIELGTALNALDAALVPATEDTVGAIGRHGVNVPDDDGPHEVIH